MEAMERIRGLQERLYDRAIYVMIAEVARDP